MRKSDYILIFGLIVLLAGAIMSYLKIEPWADYVLVAGALMVIIRGVVRSREKDNYSQPAEDNNSADKNTQTDKNASES